MLGSHQPRFTVGPAPQEPSGLPSGHLTALGPHEWQALREFISRVGGYTNACQAVELLAMLGVAAIPRQRKDAA